GRPPAGPAPVQVVEAVHVGAATSGGRSKLSVAPTVVSEALNGAARLAISGVAGVQVSPGVSPVPPRAVAYTPAANRAARTALYAPSCSGVMESAIAFFTKTSC